MRQHSTSSPGRRMQQADTEGSVGCTRIALNNFINYGEGFREPVLPGAAEGTEIV